MSLYHRLWRRIRTGMHQAASELLRQPWWRAQGMGIGRNVKFGVIRANWPHKVILGAGVLLEHGVCFKYDGIWSPDRAIVIGDRTFIGAGCEFNITKGIAIGPDALIGSGCKFIDHEHGMEPGALIGAKAGTEAPIAIGRNAWLGANVIVLKGVSIGEGAIVGAGAVVRTSIPDREIWAGVPARKIGERK